PLKMSQSWSQVSKIPARTLNVAELELYTVFKWDLWVREEDYRDWLKSTEQAVLEFERCTNETAVIRTLIEKQHLLEQQDLQYQQQLQHQHQRMEIQQYQMRKLAAQPSFAPDSFDPGEPSPYLYPSASPS
ncbi:hypothetical protein HK405_005158, partial [Cladochytrium tenue]